jgi:DNA excision repair protein ERCC-5
MNKQTILDPFFDASLGKGMFAPRLRNNYPSKRLQAVIKAFREAEARVRGDLPPSGFGDMLADLDDEPLKEINPSDSNKLNGAPEASPKVAGTSKRKVSDEDEEGNQENIDASAKKKRAPRKRKTNDGDNRSGKKASTSGRRGRGGKVVNTRASSTRSRSATVTGMEVDVQEGFTEMQPVSSPLGGQDYDELFLEIASDPIAPDDLPQRPKPKKRG